MDKVTDKDKLLIKSFLKRQEDCNHDKEFRPVGQQTLPDSVRGKLILLNTIMCISCGKQFFQTLETPVTVSAVNRTPIIR